MYEPNQELLLIDDESTTFEEASIKTNWKLAMEAEIDREKQYLVFDQIATKLKGNWVKMGIQVKKRCNRKRDQAQGPISRKGVRSRKGRRF